MQRYFTTKELATIAEKHPSTVRRNLNPAVPNPRGHVYSVRDIGKLKK
jgi:hypothetical protein